MYKQAAVNLFEPHAVTLSVPDIEEAVQWYSGKLGFQEVQRKEYPEFNLSLVFLELNDFQIELIRDGHASPGISRPDPPQHTSTFGISQITFRTSDLDTLKTALESRDVPIVWEFENLELGGRFIFIRDLNGNLIQFLQLLSS